FDAAQGDQDRAVYYHKRLHHSVRRTRPPAGDHVAGSHQDFLFDLRPEVDDPTENTVYSYLRWSERQKRRFEDARLLYVGCTRAEKKLCLSGVLMGVGGGETPQHPRRDSLLRLLWPTLGDHPQRRSSPTFVADTPGNSSSVYQRLRTTPPVNDVGPPGTAQHPPVATNLSARAYGTALHRCLESLVHRSVLPNNVDEGLLGILNTGLWEAGAPANELASLTSRAKEALAGTLADPWARWALSPGQLERRAELELVSIEDDKPISLIVDYTFIDAKSGEAWIIDYKTSTPTPGQGLDEFFDTQVHQYRDQLTNYRRALAQLQSATPRCVLYFPELAQHHELEFD
ncbi:MAG: PD-(D/E)XK nuclease family protein, partial [Pseudomonadota bacterium]